MIVPCNYVHAEVGVTDDSIHPSCIGDQKGQEDYLGNIRTVVYHTAEMFNIKEYGDKAVQMSS